MKDVVFEHPRCDICGIDDAEPLMRAEDTTYGVPGEFEIVRCRRCGLAYTAPRPTRETIGRFYPEEYRPHRSDLSEHTHRLGRLARHIAFSKKIPLLGSLYNHVVFRAFVAGGRGQRMLDVGCGVGSYLRVWRDLGWDIEGLEPDPTAARLAEERLHVPVHQSFAEQAKLPDESYDLISFSHTLEHFHSPVTALRHLRPSLRSGGRVIIMVPNFSSIWRHLFGPRWLRLEVPRHLYHFDPHSLRRVLEVAGYEDIHVHGSGHAVGLMKHLKRGMSLDLDSGNISGLGGVIALASLPLAFARRADLLWATARRS